MEQQGVYHRALVPTGVGIHCAR